MGGVMRRLRGELNALLEEIPCRRRPALRRAAQPEWLFATDLPQAAEAPALDAFTLRAEAAGWRWAPAQGWLLLARLPDWGEPPGLPALPAGEAGSLLSLLARHPSGETEPAPLFDLLKASEEGAAALETCCARLHALAAGRLRLRQPLPGGLAAALKCLLAQCDRTEDECHDPDLPGTREVSHGADRGLPSGNGPL